ncbi:hypothetical protein AVEN_144-1 [Araneus ventricosus]|uniref:Endonuclease/exonuclease/phosphatase domain-containing protein n=1 Tax=Araneus ventricosus TaxID=182803 RepID=A0A4Y2D1Y0_ARAVE|nr:hypothetical protein AVEN_144-1 [Araneus ventricosus]
MDANSKSETWYSPFSDSRGNELTEFISSHNFFVMNEDCGPTFCGTRGSSYINVTVVGTDLLEEVSFWHLPNYESLSDHKAIEFEILVKPVYPTIDKRIPAFSLKNANWNLFYNTSKLTLSIICDLIGSSSDPESLHHFANELISIIQDSC